MKILIIILLLSFSSFGDDCTHTSNSFKCVEYVKNYDADTITFNIPSTHPLLGKKIAIRVYGVDTPELRTKNSCEKKMGYRAKEYVTKLLKKAKKIDLENVKRGKYFRVVADVKLDGVSLNKKLLDAGFAYPYYGKTKKKVNWCKPLRLPASKSKKQVK